MRQLGEMFIEARLSIAREMADPTINPIYRRGFGRLLDELLKELAQVLSGKDEPEEKLHLDHDPPLGAREKVFRDGEHVGYVPDANDPEHLIYRLASAHGVKTRLRGEHGQYSDLVLIKRQRRRERKAATASGPGPTVSAGKSKWPSHPLRSASRWPKGRKLGRSGKPAKGRG